MGLRRFTMEPFMLILGPLRLTLEPWRLTMETFRLTLEHYFMFTWSPLRVASAMRLFKSLVLNGSVWRGGGGGGYLMAGGKGWLTRTKAGAATK
jgi:hypothetical protein